jgi:hypothetical protein
VEGSPRWIWTISFTRVNVGRAISLFLRFAGFGFFGVFCELFRR